MIARACCVTCSTVRQSLSMMQASAAGRRGEWARSESLSIYTPVIVKYRDDKTDLATALEDVLRGAGVDPDHRIRRL